MSKRKTNTTAKVFTGIFVTLLIFAVIGTIVVGATSSWFTNWDTYQPIIDKINDETNIPQTDNSKIPNDKVTDGDGNELEPDTIYSLPSNIIFSSDATTCSEESNITVKATTKPNEAAKYNINWDIQFVNANSNWAKGKNVSDYVKLDISSDTTIATINCLKAFGEQIKINVKTKNNNNLSANCIIDFKKKITSADVDFIVSDGTNTTKLSSSNVTCCYESTNIKTTCKLKYTFTEGTLEETTPVFAYIYLPENKYSEMVYFLSEENSKQQYKDATQNLREYKIANNSTFELKKAFEVCGTYGLYNNTSKKYTYENHFSAKEILQKTNQAFGITPKYEIRLENGSVLKSGNVRFTIYPESVALSSSTLVL